jgi:hypothetical protein
VLSMTFSAGMAEPLVIWVISVMAFSFSMVFPLNPSARRALPAEYNTNERKGALFPGDRRIPRFCP